MHFFGVGILSGGYDRQNFLGINHEYRSQRACPRSAFLPGDSDVGERTDRRLCTTRRSGKFHQLSYYGDYSAVAVLVSGLSSKADQEQLSAFAAVAEAHADEVVFWVLNHNPSTDRGAARTVLDDLQVDCLC